MLHYKLIVLMILEVMVKKEMRVIIFKFGMFLPLKDSLKQALLIKYV